MSKKESGKPEKKSSLLDKLKGKLKNVKTSIFKSIVTLSFTVAVGFTVVIGGSYVTNKFFTSSDTTKVDDLATRISGLGDSVRDSIAGLDGQLQSIKIGIDKTQETAGRIDSEIQRANGILQQTSGIIKELNIGIGNLIEHLQNGELNLTELERSNRKLTELNARLDKLIKESSSSK